LFKFYGHFLHIFTFRSSMHQSRRPYHQVFCIEISDLLEACGINRRRKFIFRILYISNKMQSYTIYFIWKLLYMFRVIPSPIIRSANNYIYSICYLSRRFCYLRLSWKSWNWFECAVGGVHPPTAHSNQFQLFHDSGR
jgi:hypothetical protein